MWIELRAQLNNEYSRLVLASAKISCQENYTHLFLSCCFIILHEIYNDFVAYPVWHEACSRWVRHSVGKGQQHISRLHGTHVVISASIVTIQC